MSITLKLKWGKCLSFHNFICNCVFFFCFATNLVPLYLWFLCHQGILLILLYLNLLGDLQCTWNQHFEQVLLVYWWLKSCEYVCKKNFLLKNSTKPRPFSFLPAFYYSGTHMTAQRNFVLLQIFKQMTALKGTYRKVARPVYYSIFEQFWGATNWDVLLTEGYNILTETCFYLWLNGK